MLTVKLTNGEILKGGGWNTLPDTPISKIALEISGHKIIMQDYESYNHLIEKAFNVIGGSTQVRAIYLMGRKGDDVQVIKVNLIDNSIITGSAPHSQEYNGRPSTGWKFGVCNLTPQYFIN